MLYTTPLISVFAFSPSVIATVVFIVFAIRHALIVKKAKRTPDADGGTALSAKKMRIAGFTALTLWILLGAFNGLLYVAVRNM